jgi:hypothetical protein
LHAAEIISIKKFKNYQIIAILKKFDKKVMNISDGLGAKQKM